MEPRDDHEYDRTERDERTLAPLPDFLGLLGLGGLGLLLLILGVVEDGGATAGLAPGHGVGLVRLQGLGGGRRLLLLPPHAPALEGELRGHALVAQGAGVGGCKRTMAVGEER